MGILEKTLRTKVSMGEQVDVTLIGGRELRGRITAFAEDGILLDDGCFERPVAFMGMATCIPTRFVPGGAALPAVKTENKEEAAAPEIKEEAAIPEETVIPAEPKPEKENKKYGLGEIVHYDKLNGYGRAQEGEEKFIFRRESIASANLWKALLEAPNTCGIRIAFTMEKNGARSHLRLPEEMETPDELEKPDFSVRVPVSADEDVNPNARVNFVDGTEMEEKVRNGMVMFYNPDKSFGRLQDMEGDRYYFRANDVMQLSLLRFLHDNPPHVVADKEVTFSVKHLPTGKTAAGRVSWKPEGQDDGDEEGEAEPAPAAQPKKQPEPQPALKRETPEPNAYCALLMRAWGCGWDEMPGRLLRAAERCGDESVRRDLLLENVALSDVRREKRDDAMLRYLRAFVREGDDVQLDGLLRTAVYDGKEMFDALTALFAMSDGALNRLSSIIAGSSEMVTLRGEILSRFGVVPETAAAMKEAWRTLIEQERKNTDYAALPGNAETLAALGLAQKNAAWKALLDAQEQDTQDDALRVQAEAVQRQILDAPSRAAVEWMLPLVEKLLEKVSAPALALRPLGAVRCAGERYACVEISGQAEEVCLCIGGQALALGAVDGRVQAALPCGEESAAVRLTAKIDGADWAQEAEMTFRSLPQNELTAQQAISRFGVAFVQGGAAELETVCGELERNPDNIAALAQPEGGSLADVLRAMLTAWQDTMLEEFGSETAGLIAFPDRDKLVGMDEAALRQALLGALGSFVDIRMIHEQLMGTQVLFLIPAFSYQAEALCEIAKELPKFSSGAVIAAEELPAHEEGQVLCEGKLGIQSVLEMAGFAGAPLRVGGDEA